MNSLDYRPVLLRHLAMSLLTIVLVLIAQHEVLTFARAADEKLHIALPPPPSSFDSPLSLADIRLPNPGPGPTAPMPLRASATTAGSAAVVTTGEAETFSISIRPDDDPLASA